MKFLILYVKREPAMKFDTNSIIYDFQDLK